MRNARGRRLAAMALALALAVVGCGGEGSPSAHEDLPVDKVLNEYNLAAEVLVDRTRQWVQYTQDVLEIDATTSESSARSTLGVFITLSNNYLAACERYNESVAAMRAAGKPAQLGPIAGVPGDSFKDILHEFTALQGCQEGTCSSSIAEQNRQLRSWLLKNTVAYIAGSGAEYVVGTALAAYSAPAWLTFGAGMLASNRAESLVHSIWSYCEGKGSDRRCRTSVSVGRVRDGVTIEAPPPDVPVALSVSAIVPMVVSNVGAQETMEIDVAPIPVVSAGTAQPYLIDGGSAPIIPPGIGGEELTYPARYAGTGLRTFRVESLVGVRNTVDCFGKPRVELLLAADGSARLTVDYESSYNVASVLVDGAPGPGHGEVRCTLQGSSVTYDGRHANGAFEVVFGIVHYTGTCTADACQGQTSYDHQTDWVKLQNAASFSLERQ